MIPTRTVWLPHILCAALVLACLATQVTVSRADDVSKPGPVLTPKAAGRLLVANLLSREYMYYGEEALHYSEAATAVGALRFAAATGDSESLERLVERYRPLLDEESGLISRRAHVDMSVIGIVPLQIAIQTGDAAFLQQGLSFADRQWADLNEEGLTAESRWWIDDLYMVGMLQIEAYRATGDEIYADRAARQLAAYLPRLQQENGLFFHSPDVPIFWGRGDGWVAAALAEVLSSLPEQHPLRGNLLASYRLMLNTLLDYQTEDGMWRQVIDYEPSWTESSATAMFAYALQLGIDRGFLQREGAELAVQKAWSALSRLIDAEGNVADVCVGTGKNNDLDYYLARPRITGDFHGQAPVLWLATELLPNVEP